MRFLNRRSSGTTPPRRDHRLRRRIFYATVALGVVVFAGTGVWLQKSGRVGQAVDAVNARIAHVGSAVGLSLASVEVEGRNRASRDDILTALGVTRGMPILAIDAAAAKTRLEALPWIRSAAVERRLPDTIFVRIVERQPLAFWQRHGQLSLIDREGAVIATNRLDDFASLIVLVGDDAPTEAPTLLEMLATEPELAAHVAAAVRVGGRRWDLRLDSGIAVALPEEDASAAWHRLAALNRSDRLLDRNIEAVDLRLNDRLVVRTVPEPPKLPAKKNRPGGKST